MSRDGASDRVSQAYPDCADLYVQFEVEYDYVVNEA